MFPVTVSIQTVVLLTLIPVQLLAVILQIVSLIECKQCLLFARIYEIERILEGGFTGWCYMLIAQGLLSIFGYIVILSKRPVWGITFNRLLYYLIMDHFIPLENMLWNKPTTWYCYKIKRKLFCFVVREILQQSISMLIIFSKFVVCRSRIKDGQWSVLALQPWYQHALWSLDGKSFVILLKLSGD